MDRAQLEEEVRRRYWFHRFEIAPGLWTEGHYQADPAGLFAHMGFPPEMSGMRALDMGCADGLFAIEMARRGAEVTAVDVFPPDFRNVEFLSALWQIPVTYVQSTIYEFQGEPFDLIFASGVLYHLQYPLLGLHRLNALCAMGGKMILESHVDRGRRLRMTFLPGRELNDDPSNWWIPTVRCFEAMARSAGFEIEKAVRPAPHRWMMRVRKGRECPPAFTPDEVMMANFGTGAS
ncbi:methyltransferase domain-containing protein [Candidatus Sumerlaeota bacterium]|nr:methyltransferase domain-containing protein [Candidatus Sumerlaeota bacterium]